MPSSYEPGEVACRLTANDLALALICRTGKRSGTAAERAAAQGLAAAGLPVRHGEAAA